MLVWVDDIIIAASNMLLTSEAKRMLKVIWVDFHTFGVFTLSKGMGL